MVAADNSLVLGATGLNAVKVGIGMTAPVVTLEMIGALAVRDDGTTTNVTSDGFALTVGNRGYIRLTSNSNTTTSRTLTLSDGLVRGQILVIENVDGGSDTFEIDDNAATNNTNVVSARALGPGDSIMLLWNGTDWMELGFNNN